MDDSPSSYLDFAFLPRIGYYMKSSGGMLQCSSIGMN